MTGHSAFSHVSTAKITDTSRPTFSFHHPGLYFQHQSQRRRSDQHATVHNRRFLHGSAAKKEKRSACQAFYGKPLQHFYQEAHAFFGTGLNHHLEGMAFASSKQTDIHWHPIGDTREPDARRSDHHSLDFFYEYGRARCLPFSYFLPSWSYFTASCRNFLGKGLQNSGKKAGRETGLFFATKIARSVRNK